jgi:hypothetical protein
MALFKKCYCLFFPLLLLGIVAGCSTEVGSEEWCQELKEKPKADWTAKEAADYAKHCLIR